MKTFIWILAYEAWKFSDGRNIEFVGLHQIIIYANLAVLKNYVERLIYHKKSTNECHPTFIYHNYI